MPRKSIRLAQNFLRSRDVVSSFVSQARLDRNDVVYEIGPGRGIITRELAAICSRVVAIEIDPGLCSRLRARFSRTPNVEVIHADFTRYRVPEAAYKVVSNIPFNATACLLRAILYGGNPPVEAHLIVQREPARKYAGIPRSTRCSVLAGPWFEVEIVRSFRRSDFDPEPGVDCVLLRISRRDPPLLSRGRAGLFGRFVRYGFARCRRNLRRNFKRVFTHRQWRRMAAELHFDAGARPADLTPVQWVGIFRFFVEGIARSQVGVPDELSVRRRPPRRTGGDT